MCFFWYLPSHHRGIAHGSQFYLAAVIVLIIMIISTSEAAQCGTTRFDENLTETESEEPASPCRRRLAGIGWRQNSPAGEHNLGHSEMPCQKILIPLSRDQLELRKGYSEHVLPDHHSLTLRFVNSPPGIPALMPTGYLLKHSSFMIIGLLFDIAVGFHLMLTVEKLGKLSLSTLPMCLCISMHHDIL